MEEAKDDKQPDDYFDRVTNPLWALFIRKVNEMLKRTNPEAEFVMPEKKDKHFVGTVLRYFAKDQEFYDSELFLPGCKPSLDKGLLIIGNCGVGKTLIMEAWGELSEYTGQLGNSYRATSANNIVRRYDAVGQKGIEHFFKGAWYFDDFGTETVGMNYGKKEEVMRLIIEERERLLKKSGTKTYMSSNLVPKEIKERYGARVYDRLFSMFNIIVYGRDKSFRE